MLLTSKRFPRLSAGFLLASSLAGVTACGDGAATHGKVNNDDDVIVERAVKEEYAPQPRVVMTYNGGIVVLDATSLKTIANFELEGFNRLNSVGDERHVAISTTGGWTLLDAGAWTVPHGDHSHYYTTQPSISGVIFEAEIPGHVVAHDGYTVLFDDGTGRANAFKTSDWTTAMKSGRASSVREYAADAPHHGVAVLSKDGRLLVTLPDRSGAMILNENNEPIVINKSCPGVHGETASETAGGSEYMMVGCEDGVVLFDANGATKISSPDAYGRIGNQFSSDGSDIVLGDYRNDPNAGLAVSLIALVNVVDHSLKVVDPFESAQVLTTWRGLRRGDEGEVLVLGTDGALRVIEPTTGDVVRLIQVIAPWKVPEQWQTAHPALDVVAGKAYVTEPSSGAIYAVDYVTGKVTNSAVLGVEMNEIVGVEG